MKRNQLFIAILVIMSALTACKSRESVKSHTDTVVSEVKTVVDNSAFIGRRWKLVELMGKPVTYSEGQTEAFVTFHADGKVHGNAGCNTFNGTYTLQEGYRIQFSQMVSTSKMCLDTTVEASFLRVLETTDNYNLNDDKLVLNRARMAPLARFEAIYM